MPCQVCARIGKAIASFGSEFDEIAMGRYEDFKKSALNCKTCRTVLSKCSDEATLDPETFIYVLNHKAPDSDFQIADEGQDLLYLELAPLAPLGTDCSRGIQVDESWIDIHRVKRWLEFCDGAHGNSCVGFPAQSSIGPAKKLLLIDVIDGCLVQAPGTARYFALSYVWGKSSGHAVLETTVANVLAHKMNGALGSHREDLPDTIRDSIRLVKRLGERYLWVDRLCIIQDDWTQKAEQINQMGAIYAYSYCTIIAAGGDGSNYGLRGVGGGSKPRRLSQQTLDLPGLPCLLLGDPSRAEQSSFWNTRGWTYQEKIMSRRALVFADESVMWRCQRTVWREDLTGDPEGVRRPAPSTYSWDVFTPSSWPNLRQWQLLVQKYNRRNLSFESDRLAAMAGIEAVLSHSFPGRFIYGLPSFFFDAALLWQPAKPMKRRYGSSESDGPINNGNLPSWSWVGWHGPMDAKAVYPGFDYFRNSDGAEGIETGTACTTMPLVTWWQHERSGELRRIDNSYEDWRSLATDNGALPLGWTKEKFGDEETPHFAHIIAPDVQFNWPIPIQYGLKQTTSGPLAPYLSFRSKRAYFTIGEQVPSPDFIECQIVCLNDCKGDWAGILRLNQPKSDPVPTGQVCEMVAISRGRAPNTGNEKFLLEEWDLPERPSQDQFYNFYNVLWVGREVNGVTRKALGRVEKSVWDCQVLDECDFTLQ